MKVVLNVLSGPSQGRKVPLQTGELARFGCSEAADVCLSDSSMADIHFELECGLDSCSFRSANSASLVNGKPVKESELSDGDEILAGQTRMQVKLSTTGAVESETSEKKPADDPSISLEELCVQIELDDHALEYLDAGQTPEAFADALVSAGQPIDAVRVLAHAMPKTQSVQWALAAIDAFAKQQMTEKERFAMETAEKWLKEPVEENRRAAMAEAETLEYGSAAACVAAAAGWSGGSMVPPDLDVIPPDPLLTGRMSSICIQMVASHQEDVDEYYRQVIELGKSLADQVETKEK